MNKEAVIEATDAAMALAAGYLAGAIDRRLGGTTWTIRVYMRMREKPITIEFLYKLETDVRMHWPNEHLTPALAVFEPPRLSDIWNPKTGIVK